MIEDLVLDFILLGALLGQIIIGLQPRRRRTTRGRESRPLITRRAARRADVDRDSWARRWYGCPPIRSHRAAPDVAWFRDWMDREGLTPEWAMRPARRA